MPFAAATHSVASATVWAVTLAGVLFFFALDFVLTRRPHTVEFREALAWTAFYLALPVGFAVFAWSRSGHRPRSTTSPVGWWRSRSRWTTCSCSCC